MDRKETHEREVFFEFASAAGLVLDHGTVESCKPPEPDIRCMVDGQAVYFELGRLLDHGMQRLKLRMLRGYTFSNVDAEDVRLPEREVLRRKLEKEYVASGTPIDLVLYYDNEDWLVGDVPVFDDSGFGWHAGHVMRPLIDAQREFRQVWVYERHRRTVLWCYASD